MMKKCDVYAEHCIFTCRCKTDTSAFVWGFGGASNGGLQVFQINAVDGGATVLGTVTMRNYGRSCDARYLAAADDTTCSTRTWMDNESSGDAIQWSLEAVDAKPGIVRILSKVI